MADEDPFVRKASELTGRVVMLRSQARAARWLPPGSSRLQSAAARELCAAQEEARTLLPEALATILAPDEPEDQEDAHVWRETRDVLLRQDLVTAHELQVFPTDSLVAIVAERIYERQIGSGEEA